MPYNGPISLGNQPKSWINRHLSFASEVWIEQEIRWRPWQRRGPNGFVVYTWVDEGTKTVQVELKAICHRRNGRIILVEVFHAHLL